MITLAEAVKLLDLRDDDIVHLCRSRHESLVDGVSVKTIRNRFDMQNILVKKVYPDHFIYDSDVSWEFIITNKG